MERRWCRAETRGKIGRGVRQGVKIRGERTRVICNGKR